MDLLLRSEQTLDCVHSLVHSFSSYLLSLLSDQYLGYKGDEFTVWTLPHSWEKESIR